MNQICYVLTSFPHPSETFISGEAASMRHAGITPYILYLHEGDYSILQDSAREIIEAKLTKKIVTAAKHELLWSLVRLFHDSPRRTSACIARIARAVNAATGRRHLRALPYAVFLLKNNIQFIHAHFAAENLRMARILSEFTGIPFGVTTHGYDLRDDPIPVPELSIILAQARLVVTISRYNKAVMVEKYGIPADNIKVIHSGIDLQQFRAPADANKLMKQQLRIVNVGRLVPEKGQDVLLRALAYARDRGLEFELKIIGSGPLLGELVALSRTLQLEDQVVFLGAQSQVGVKEQLEDADIFVLSSRKEGLPVVCMEAMAMEVFMIGTRITGVPEIVVDGENGLLVEPDDAQALAGAMLWADQNRALLPDMCLAARRRIEREFNRNTCTRNLLREMEKSLVPCPAGKRSSFSWRQIRGRGGPRHPPLTR